MATCVFCASTTDLNTQLTIALEGGQKVSVQICDAHAEEATVKTARDAYLERQRKIEEVLAQAKSLGLDLAAVRPQGAILVAQTASAAAPAPVPAAPAVAAPLEGPDVVPTERLDRFQSRAIQSPGGQVSHQAVGAVSVAGYNSIALSGLEDQLPPEVFRGHAKMTVVEGRDGQPLSIPERRVDGTGTTYLRVAKTETDERLQSRFKRMAHESQYDRTPDFARGGYQNAQSTCPACRGQMVVKTLVNGVAQEIACPKCKGVGVVSRY